MSENDETEDISTTDVVAYLRDHPDFFNNQKTLLAELNLPHESGKTISLVERQVNILRDRNMDMRRRMNELLQTARVNDDLFTKTRSLTLALVEAGSMQDLNELLATHVLVDFEADFVACHLVHDKVTDVGPLDHFNFHDVTPAFADLISNETATCTPLRENELAAIFPSSTHEGPGSAVLLPLNSTVSAILAIGSRDGARFSQSMDTLFVAYIADILAAILPRVLPR